MVSLSCFKCSRRVGLSTRKKEEKGKSFLLNSRCFHRGRNAPFIKLPLLFVTINIRQLLEMYFIFMMGVSMLLYDKFPIQIVKDASKTVNRVGIFRLVTYSSLAGSRSI